MLAASRNHGPLARRSEAGVEAGIIVAVVVGVILCLSLALIFILRSLRSAGHSPKYIPTPWLKNKWRTWTPWSEKRRASSALQSRPPLRRSPSTTDTQDMASSSRYDGLSTMELGAGDSVSSSNSTHQQTNDAGIDRNTSVRSVMTLPAYTTTPRATEQLVGREGERAGMDVVVEFPETAAVDEARREEEMAGLYRIRAARREEQARRRAERELRDERRIAQREARDRGDREALAQLRAQARWQRERSAHSAERARQISEDLIAEHQERVQQRERGRRVSAVAYGSLGVARHDGSRVRSDSASSDVRPLLDAAAGMGTGTANGGRTRAGSSTDRLTSFHSHGHGREASTSSLSRFAVADYSDDDRSDGGRSRRGSAAQSSFEFVPTPLRGSSDSISNTHSRPRGASASAPLLLETTHSNVPPEAESIAQADLPPPDYANLSPVELRRLQTQFPGQLERERERRLMGEAPPYESPTAAPRLPGIARLPSIHITPFTPVVGGDTPVVGGEGWSSSGSASAGSGR